MAASPLIMVRFSKFKIWHTQDSDADLPDVMMTSRVTCEMTSRACDVNELGDLVLSHYMTSSASLPDVNDATPAIWSDKEVLGVILDTYCHGAWEKVCTLWVCLIINRGSSAHLIVATQAYLDFQTS